MLHAVENKPDKSPHPFASPLVWSMPGGFTSFGGGRDGYQNVVRNEGDNEWNPISRRFRNKEKEVTSPYPFLDVASDLVAQLAVAS